MDRLPFAVRSLIIGDLPTNLWWAAPQPPALVGSLLFEFAEGAQQIMYDSLGWTDPTHGVAATAAGWPRFERIGKGHPWRRGLRLELAAVEILAAFTGAVAGAGVGAGVADSASEVLVEHGPHAVVQAWELASWCTLRLGWQVQAGRVQQGAEMSWRCLRASGESRVRLRCLPEGPPEVRRVNIKCRLGDVEGAINAFVDSDVRLAVTLEGVDAAPGPCQFRRKPRRN